MIPLNQITPADRQRAAKACRKLGLPGVASTILARMMDDSAEVQLAAKHNRDEWSRANSWSPGEMAELRGMARQGAG